jgi:autotransporter family porin
MLLNDTLHVCYAHCREFYAGGTHLSDYYRTGDGKYSWRWAVTCPADVNGSYRTGWINATYGVGCNEVPATTGSPTVLNSNASWYVLAGSNLTVGADVITIGATNISYLGTNSFSLIGNQYLTHGSINFTDVTATLTNSSGGGIKGLSTHNTVPINGNNFP